MNKILLKKNYNLYNIRVFSILLNLKKKLFYFLNDILNKFY
jgi:hypothetical protein